MANFRSPFIKDYQIRTDLLTHLCGHGVPLYYISYISHLIFHFCWTNDKFFGPIPRPAAEIISGFLQAVSHIFKFTDTEVTPYKGGGNFLIQILISSPTSFACRGITS